MNTESKTIAFVQPYVPAYRKGLFDAIEARLAIDGFDLEVWHAEPEGRAAARRNSIHGSWSRLIKQKRIRVGGHNITFRPILRRARKARVVVAGLASTNLETYLLAADPRVTLMLWGQGRNFTASTGSIDAKLESWLCRKAIHVFAYTDEGRDHLIANGVGASKVSTVRNTTDTEVLREAQASASEDRIQTYKSDLGLEGKNVAMFVGAFDAPKRLPFLFQATDLVAEQDPEFRLVLAGAGPLDDYVDEQCLSRSYASTIGRMDTAELGALSNVIGVFLMPGRVGLVAVDSLALGVPLVTTRYAFHAPEAAYLNESNSVWTDDDPVSFADGIAQLFRDPDRMLALRDEARRNGMDFSMKKSAQVFVSGIYSAGLENE